MPLKVDNKVMCIYCYQMFWTWAGQSWHLFWVHTFKDTWVRVIAFLALVVIFAGFFVAGFFLS